MMLNPVLDKELRDRVRTWRSPLLITIYLGILALVGGFFYYTQTRYNYGGPQTLRLGVQIFDILALLQLILIAFITPGMTAGIISGERERQTLPLLQVTRLSSFSVASGKLLSATSYILLLIVVSMPLYSVVFLFGGVSLGQLFQAVGIFLVTTLTLGSIGLYCSATFKRTTVAVVISYALTFFLLAGTIFLAVMYQELTRQPSGVQQFTTPFILYFNPVIALGSILPMGRDFVPFVANGNGVVTDFWQTHLLLDVIVIAIALSLTVWLINPLRRGSKRSD